jgi:DNA-binding NtrC family response regulator
VELPPLRRRREDLPALIEYFVSEAAREIGRPVIINAEAIRAATEHAWPGNIRALRNAVTRAAALTDGPIGPRDLLPRGPQRHVELIAIPRGDYAAMKGALLDRVIAEEGSIRRAAQALGVPRSTLGSWLKKGRPIAP